MSIALLNFPKKTRLLQLSPAASRGSPNARTDRTISKIARGTLANFRLHGDGKKTNNSKLVPFNRGIGAFALLFVILRDGAFSTPFKTLTPLLIF